MSQNVVVSASVIAGDINTATQKAQADYDKAVKVQQEPINISNTAIADGEYTFSKYAGYHLDERNLKVGDYQGMLKRPYMRSPLTIKSIMSIGEGIPDATWPGGFNWKVPGTFRGSQGFFELGINPKTNTIYHFNFVDK